MKTTQTTDRPLRNISQSESRAISRKGIFHRDTNHKLKIRVLVLVQEAHRRQHTQLINRIITPNVVHHEDSALPFRPTAPQQGLYRHV